MAGALVGGALLSGFINVVFDRLLSPEALNLILGKKLDQHLLERLKTALTAAEALLIDAEHKQFHNPTVKEWLHSLKDAVYDADDLLDRVFTEAATQKKQVSNFLPRFLNLKDREMVTKMEEIVRRIEDLEKRKYILGLKHSPKENLSWRTPSTSLVEGEIYGRKNDQEAIIKLLMDDNTEDKISVIPIVGIGGVGKTTLAQWLYNNEDLMKEFDLKGWVCVSEESDVVKITKTMVEAVTSRACEMKDLNSLQLDLKDKLIGKKFFIVLDDVWNVDCDGWNNLKKPFQYGNRGSKIIVTTRSKEVASVLQTYPPYFLNELSDEYCWSIFANYARFSESNGNLTLENIGREIVKKCKGLPLAAQTLGSLLRAKHDVSEWNAILTSDIWEFSVKNSKIVPALLMSYYHLPPQLKRCFIYCSLYPKDYTFNKDELILLWMAEGLLEQPKRGKTLEEVGYESFDDLASRLFFKQFLDHDKSFVMHDLIHDLATFIASEFYFRSEEHETIADEMSMKTRHLSFEGSSPLISKNFNAFDRIKSLRTLLAIDNILIHRYFGKSTIFMTFSMLKCLRVLSFFSFENLHELPDSIRELIHLRYLNLSGTPIRTLTESLGDLYNLQTLKLSDCYQLTMLPNSMQNLANLRHLDISRTNLEEMPPGMSKLKNVQFLSDFIVGKHEENGIKELGILSNLHISLSISKLENIANNSEALEARILDKTHIELLTLEWSEGVVTSVSSQTERDILDKLQPHKGLQKLTIMGYRGTMFPEWVGHSSYYNMTCVCLRNCRNCCMLPSLGQLPSLKSLKIKCFDRLVNIGADFYKRDDAHSSLAASFPSLENLSFYNMPCWEEWLSSEPDAFPQLKKLKIGSCPKLRGNLPDNLPALETLEIRECGELVSSLPRAPTIRELRLDGSKVVGLKEIPLSLQSLSIHGCEPVKSMFEAMNISRPTSLQSLKISECLCAISFPRDGIPGSVKNLKIINCRKLEFPNKQQHQLLKSLIICDSCDSLTSFTLESFPNLDSLTLNGCKNLESVLVSQDSALQDLFIHYCNKLKSLPCHMNSLLPKLEYLWITNCPGIGSFPDGGLPPNLESLEIRDCNKLKSLPCHMNTLLPKLRELEITNCLGIGSFPDGGLPPKLKSLGIGNCEKLLSGLSLMGMHDSLTVLSIRGPCESVKSFPKEGLLPQLPSLTTLVLRGLSSLETLACKELLHLTSLQTLIIEFCPKLEKMTGKKLPASLISLQIYGSPLLEEQCKMKHPQIWPKISHIHDIYAAGNQTS